jgi:Ricin-type beta-trefoil lectin domain
MNSLRFGLVIAASIAWIPASASAQSIDQSFYYKLSTEFRGASMNLDVFNGGPKNNLIRLEPDQDVSGQYWRLKSNGDGTFRLLTMFRGTDMCLDIYNGGTKNNQPHLVKCANFTGQFWNVLVSEEGEAVRLTTIFRGPGMCLDIYNGGPNNNQPHLTECGKLTGQHWILTKTDKRVDEDDCL